MRIYITSRARTPDSASPSDFNFALNRPLELPEGSRGYIDSFVCSNTWEAVQAGVNQRIYCQWSGDVPLKLTLDAGDLASTADLATKLTAALAVKAPSQKTVTVTAVGTSRIKFSCPTLVTGETFTVYARSSLLSGSAGYTATSSGFMDGSALVGAMAKDLICRDAAAAGSLNTPADATSNFSPFQTIYLHSHIGTPESYGPSGETTVIASIVVGNTVPGDLVTHHHNGLLASPIDLPPLIGIMHFSLRSWDGKVMDMQGHDVAFTLVVDTANN
jgi:hypothetical protein